MKLKWLPMLWFCYGVSIGVLLGANLGRGFSEAAFIVILALGILFLVSLWRPIERAMHTQNLKSWEQHHIRGKWYYVITRYCLLGGSLLLFVLVAPVYTISGISITDSRYTAMIIVLLSIATIWTGRIEWASCEREITARSIREGLNKPEVPRQGTIE